MSEKKELMKDKKKQIPPYKHNIKERGGAEISPSFDN